MCQRGTLGTRFLLERPEDSCHPEGKRILSRPWLEGDFTLDSASPPPRASPGAVRLRPSQENSPKQPEASRGKSPALEWRMDATGSEMDRFRELVPEPPRWVFDLVPLQN